MFRRRAHSRRRRTTWGVSTQVVSRNGTNTPLSSGRTHVATGESGRRPGWPPPGTQASRHDMNSGWTCCAEAFGPGSRRAPLRSTPPSRLSAHTRLTKAVGWPLPQPAATPGLRGHWVLASQRPHQSAFSVGEPHSPVGYTKGLARHRGMMVDMPRPPGVCDTGSWTLNPTQAVSLGSLLRPHPYPKGSPGVGTDTATLPDWAPIQGGGAWPQRRGGWDRRG